MIIFTLTCIFLTDLEQKAKPKPAYHFAGIKQFNKKLTNKKLMQSDLCDEDVAIDSEYKDKVAKCFQMRTQELKKKRFGENQKWEAALNTEKNYIMYKQGYKHMLRDLEHAKKNMSKFKRGLSIFEDGKLREQLTS